MREQREIKFRAWDSKTKSMGIPFSPFPSMGGIFDKHIILMQFTGLKDKNGKEIYEGDILAHGGDNHNSVVVWSDDYGVPGFHAEESALREEYPFKRIHGLPPTTAPMEVIGNIYENPKLKYRWGKS